jgi:DNA-binding NtrC family response regulator
LLDWALNAFYIFNTPFAEVAETKQTPIAVPLFPSASPASEPTARHSVIRAKGQILLVDNNAARCSTLANHLASEGYAIRTASSSTEAQTYLEQGPFDVVLASAQLARSADPPMLRHCREHYPGTAVVILDSERNFDSAFEAVRQGAYDYITEPIRVEEIKTLLERVLNQPPIETLPHTPPVEPRSERLLGNDPRVRRAAELIETVADTRVPIFLCGESGTGKTLAARLIHRLSGRRDQPFVKVACGPLSEVVLISDLFGQTGKPAEGTSPEQSGKFLLANGGTVYLEEIDTLSATLQLKLLRLLQDDECEPAGAVQPQRVDVRLILGTQRPLWPLVVEGKFRKDLYYRIHVAPLELPALRERPGDISLLAEHFLKRFSQLHNRRLEAFTSDTLNLLQGYAWPGNVGELENVVERAVVLSKGPRIEVKDLRALLGSEMVAPAAEPFQPMPLKQALEGPERRIILQTLQANHWNRQATAAVLGINRTTLYKKMKRLNLDQLEPKSAEE